MERREKILTLFFFIFSTIVINCEASEIMDTVINKEKGDIWLKTIDKFTSYLTQSLEQYNDDHIGRSAIGKFIKYFDIKPKMKGVGRKSSKMSSMLPLIFHIGAASTWILITGLLAAKSVAVGIILLVFKIAVSSAKVASFFSSLKQKSSEHSDRWSSNQHYGSIDSHRMNHELWQAYSPNWSYDIAYTTIPQLDYENKDSLKYATRRQ